MPIVTALALSVFLLTMTGCVATSPPPAAQQGPGKKTSAVEPAKHDEKKSMNEESHNAVMDR